MNHVSKVTSNKTGSQAIEDSRKIDLKEFERDNELALLNNLQTDQEVKPTIPNLFLREKIEAIQKVKKELGIESQAAIEPATIVTTAIFTYFASKFSHPVVKFFNEKVVKPLGPYWNDNLLSHDSTLREKAIQEYFAEIPLRLLSLPNRK